VIDAGILPHLKALLESPRKASRKEVCWLVSSNIAAGTTKQIGLLFSRGGIVKRIVHNAATDAPWETRKEAIWAVSDEEVYKKTIKMFEGFFSADDDVDNENLAPATTDEGTFSFGVSKQLRYLISFQIRTFPSTSGAPKSDFGVSVAFVGKSCFVLGCFSTVRGDGRVLNVAGAICLVPNADTC
jgi:hypothetical protein